MTPIHGRRFLLLAAAASLAGCRPGAPYARVDIIARNYAFTAPATLPPGLTAFRLINQGTVRHELQLFRFAEGISTDSARRILASGDFPDGVAEEQGGILVGLPGDSVRQQILDNLRSGAVYGLNCEFHDSAGAPAHSKLGMFAVFRVQ